MHLSDDHITQYQEIYKKNFGKEISKTDAYDQGMKLLRLMQLINKPISEEEYKETEREVTEIQRRMIPQHDLTESVKLLRAETRGFKI